MRSDGAVARPSGRVRRAQAKRRAAGWDGFVSSGPGAAGAQELEHARALCPPEMLIIPLSHLQVVPWSTMAPFQSTMSVPCRYPVVPDVAYHRGPCPPEMLVIPLLRSAPQEPTVTFRDFRGFRGRRQTRRSAARRKPRCPSPTGFRRSATPAPGLNGLARARICTGTGRPPCPHLRGDWACRLSIGTGVGLTPATSAPGLGSPLPHPPSPSAQVTRDVLSGARWMDVTAANVRSALPVRPRRRRGPGCHSRSPPLGTHQHGQVAKCARACCRRWW